MELIHEDLEEGLRKIDLAGRFDLEGANEIDLRFTTLVATQKSFIIVDLSQVDFIASLAISVLIRNARAIRLREGNLVLLNPQPNVARVLASTRVDQVVAVCQDLEEARSQLRSTPSPLA